MCVRECGLHVDTSMNCILGFSLADGKYVCYPMSWCKQGHSQTTKTCTHAQKNTHTHKHARATHTRTHVHTGGTLDQDEAQRVLTVVGVDTLLEVQQRAQGLSVPGLKRKDGIQAAIVACSTWRLGLRRHVPPPPPAAPPPPTVQPPPAALPPPTVQPSPAAPPLLPTVQQPPAAPRLRVEDELVNEIVTTFFFV